MAGIRPILQKLREERPGRRFRRACKEADGARRKLGRPLLVLLGTVLVVAGLFFLAVPGPGLLILGAGLFLFSLVSRRIARRLDRSEVVLRRMVDWAKRQWRAAPRGAKAVLIASGVLLSAAVGYALLHGLVFLPGS